MKRSHTHEPGKCEIAVGSGKENLKCANCGNAGHPASYRGCPYLKAIAISKKASIASRNAATQRRINRVSTTTTPGRSYAQAANYQATPSPWNDPERLQQFSNQQAAQNPTQRPCNLGNYYPPPPLNDYNNTQTHSWLDNLKKEIASLISDQLSSIALQVAQNTS